MFLRARGSMWTGRAPLGSGPCGHSGGLCTHDRVWVGRRGRRKQERGGRKEGGGRQAGGHPAEVLDGACSLPGQCGLASSRDAARVRGSWMGPNCWHISIQNAPGSRNLAGSIWLSCCAYRLQQVCKENRHNSSSKSSTSLTMSPELEEADQERRQKRWGTMTGRVWVMSQINWI